MPFAARPANRRLWMTLSATVALALMAACGTPGPSPSPSTPAAARPPAGAASSAPALQPPVATLEAMEAERRWLQSWFESTPVRIALRSDGALAVEVPLEFCFEAGGSRIRPPLAAVLDKVAESLRRRPQLRVDLLAAPSEDGAAPTLVPLRGQQLRQHLRSRGVPDNRLAAATATSAAAVQLRLR